MPYWYWNLLRGIEAQVDEQSPCKGSGAGSNPANAFLKVTYGKPDELFKITERIF